MDAHDLAHERHDQRFVVVLPGQAKLRTTVSLNVGREALTVNAFVCRKPDENAEQVYRWLLEQNTRMFAIAFGLDRLGDIYLVGRLPIADLGQDDLDRLLGSIAQAADGSFNTILRMGFATAIRRERTWRESRGEPTTNLAAFTETEGTP